MARRSRPTVLHVDDDPLVRRAVARTLASAGFKVVSEADGPAGLAAIRRVRPELVVLDVDLPGLSGFEVCVRLRADRATRRIPVLHLSGARRDVPDRVRGLEGGADAYLVQPVAPEELIAVARALVGRVATRRDGARAASKREAAAAREGALHLAAYLLRAPLTTIAINASGLVTACEDPVARSRAKAVSEAHAAAERVLAALAELAYLDSGRTLLPLEACAPSDLVASALRSVARTRQDAAVTVDAPSEPPVRCDPRRLEYVLVALIDRAARTSAAGAAIGIGARPEGSDVRFWVEGGALGRDDEHEQLAGTFWAAGARRQDGPMLELALIRAVVDAHRGRVWFDRERPIVHVTIPRSPLAQP